MPARPLALARRLSIVGAGLFLASPFIAGFIAGWLER